MEEAAAYLRISRGLAFAAVRDGSLACVRIGRRILIPRRQLEALLDGAPPPTCQPSGHQAQMGPLRHLSRRQLRLTSCHDRTGTQLRLAIRRLS